MKKHKILIAAGVGITLLLVGAFIGRNVIRDATATSVDQTIDMEEIITDMMTDVNGVLEKTGSFIEVDAIHKGTGSAEVYKTDNNPVLVFNDEFTVTNGPDLVVYLSPNNVAAGEDLGDFVTLGDLHDASGAQAYNLPENYQDFKSVVVWCRAFGVLFSAADLEAAS